MEKTRVWILGASDPEMQAIEKVLREAGETVAFAAVGGARVHPGNAYAADSLLDSEGRETGINGRYGHTPIVYAVECDGPAIHRCLVCGDLPDPDHDGLGIRDKGQFGGVDRCGDMHAFPRVVVIDHHRPGDPGYGKPPEEYFEASSIGQVLTALGLAILYSDREEDAVRFLSDCEGGLPVELDWSGIGDIPAVGGGVFATVRPGINRWPYGKSGQWDGKEYPYDFDLDPDEALFIAAADHCLAAAYAGECLGVDPDALMRWRAETRAAYQKRSVEDILADIEATRAAFRHAPTVDLGGEPVKNFREAYTITTALVAPFAEGATVDAAGVGDDRYVVFGKRDTGVWDEGGHHTHVGYGAPELPEAAARDGVAYIASVRDRDGRWKVVLGGRTTPEQVRAFLESWAPDQGLVDIYGDPARGFAGGYLPAE